MERDDALAERVRGVLRERAERWSEKAMFGGLGFMVDGHLALSASGRGGLMLRVDPSTAQESLADPRISPFQMRGRAMRGWLHVAVDADVAEAELADWVAGSIDYARSLPEKAIRR